MNQTTEKQTNRTYDVLVEKTGKEMYTARVLAWPDCAVEAATRDEALRHIRTLILERLAKAEIVTLEFMPAEINNPWLKFAGMWKDNPDFDEFLAEIERYRREIDEEQAPWLFESAEESSKEPEKEAVLV